MGDLNKKHWLFYSTICQILWSARVDSVRPFAAHLPGLKEAIVLLQELDLTAETRSEVHGIQIYLDTFESILMASI